MYVLRFPAIIVVYLNLFGVIAMDSERRARPRMARPNGRFMTTDELDMALAEIDGMQKRLIREKALYPGVNDGTTADVRSGVATASRPATKGVPTADDHGDGSVTKGIPKNSA